jgi:predicted O-methyltransferase YrrM
MMIWPDAAMSSLIPICMPHGTRAIGQILFWLAYQGKGDTLETGIWDGYVTLLLARAASLAKHRHTSIEINPDHCWRVWDIVKANALDANCTIVCGDSLSLSAAAVEHLAVLFLDSDHAEAHVRAEWAQFSPLLLPNGTAVLHDTTKEPGPAALVADLRRDPAWTVMSWPEGPGWSMVRRAPKE